MNNKQVVFDTDLPLPSFYQGKVRDTYTLGNLLLIVVTDRISAFDSILPSGIPEKGLVLNQLSTFWFNQTRNIVPNHLTESVEDINQLCPYLPGHCNYHELDYVLGRSMLVKKAERIDIECVVRGYISGSAWQEYLKHGTVNKVTMPKGLQESQEFPEPLFTPTTKADTGHDEPITMAEMKQEIGDELAERIKEKSLAVYNYARKYAIEKGIIIADTKMEFGMDNGELILIDELLTPDSSRFWDAEKFEVGKSQPSFDKQPVRDWLVEAGWNKEPPAPKLPEEVIKATTKRYRQAYEQLTGNKLG